MFLDRKKYGYELNGCHCSLFLLDIKNAFCMQYFYFNFAENCNGLIKEYGTLDLKGTLKTE